jgi:redox-sensitive bicupin YhaK (pirin superfamily)
MSIFIYPVDKHEKGGFNDGEILENKPVQLTEDPTKLKPYSNLFYWAHAWSDEGSTIGQHPHKAFEIMSFVLKGSIEHYDTKGQQWISLKEGDVQIIRAGSGISHSEKLNAGSQMFQIWLDPGIEKVIHNPASYNDYPADSFPVKNENGMTIKTFYGEGAPMTMETPGVKIQEILLKEGEHSLKLNKENYYSIYIISGDIETGEGSAEQDDFIVLKDEGEFKFSSAGETKIFMIETPGKLDYKTYAERY